MAKFLIIRFSSIGDIVLTTPVVRLLKTQVKDAEVHFATKIQYSPILKDNPYIDKIFYLEKNLYQLINLLKNEDYDFVIDLHNSLRSRIMRLKLRRKTFTINKINVAKWLKVNLKFDILPNKHIVNRYLDTLNSFNIENDYKGLDYFVPTSDRVSLTALPFEFRNGYIAFVIGAKHNTKRLPKEKIISICNKIKHPIIILSGPEDHDLAEEICQNTSGVMFNGCGEFTLNQSASVVQHADLVISHDTGLMHIASAFHKKIISIWGSTIPEFGMYPYIPDNDSVIVEVKPLKCRPCSKIGYEKCPKEHFNCMNQIDEDKINKAVIRILRAIDVSKKQNTNFNNNFH